MRRSSGSASTRLTDEAAARLASREKGPEQTVHDGMFDDDIQRALDALQPDFRAAVVLCDIEGLPTRRSRRPLGVKLGTVRSRIHRGRAQLREALAHRAPSRPVVEAPTTGSPCPSRRRCRPPGEPPSGARSPDRRAERVCRRPAAGCADPALGPAPRRV